MRRLSTSCSAGAVREPSGTPRSQFGDAGCLGVTPARGPRGEGGVGGIRRAAGSWPRVLASCCRGAVGLCMSPSPRVPCSLPTPRGTLGCSPFPFPRPAASQSLELPPGADVSMLRAGNGPAGVGAGCTLWAPKALLFHEGAARPQLPECTWQRCRGPGGRSQTRPLLSPGPCSCPWAPAALSLQVVSSTAPPSPSTAAPR